ncbi:hypothetical protein SACE_6098 [Saccharopolyspora erythraea NRRL 2338]|uniref:Uncharacterized protein n=1 Tax=Saccharopolyspora erythraea (strain ATCC 11635 / DSM 40517 / JCM 4748 / NBRC 13426 / NCIMB 8594 / NRRL 2338) TaxID=405948 RepID=A4FMJ6_SACEN|nr:hypothetical protein SACE_6098 [Saccharopolyspora erythraea NRRL 2338]
MRELSNSFFGDPDYIDEIGDAGFYEQISIAVSCFYGPASGELPAALSRRILEKVETRLRQGWFAEPRLASPQSRYASGSELPPVELESDEADPAVASKPRRAVWTSSFLPDGTSVLDLGRPVVPKSGRRLYSVRFDPSGVDAYTIDELQGWCRLVESYPVECTDGMIGVSWTAVARDFDVVHLTARGLVHAQGVVVETAAGPSVLRHWDAESSAWFRFPANTEIR